MEMKYDYKVLDKEKKETFENLPSAEEMFKELDLEKFMHLGTINYMAKIKGQKKRALFICFDLLGKYYAFGTSLDIIIITPELHKAINKQCEELGW